MHFFRRQNVSFSAAQTGSDKVCFCAAFLSLPPFICTCFFGGFYINKYTQTATRTQWQAAFFFFFLSGGSAFIPPCINFGPYFSLCFSWADAQTHEKESFFFSSSFFFFLFFRPHAWPNNQTSELSKSCPPQPPLTSLKGATWEVLSLIFGPTEMTAPWNNQKLLRPRGGQILLVMKEARDKRVPLKRHSMQCHMSLPI